MRQRKEQAVDKRALTAPVPETQTCDVCGDRPGAEHHFITVPLPAGFTRICDEDLAIIKKEIRGRVKEIVRVVFRDAMHRHRNI